MGCRGWFCARATTNGELDAALREAETCGEGAYVEVVTGKMASSPLALELHKSIRTLYGNR